MLLACLSMLAGARRAEAAQLSFTLYAVSLPVASSTMTFNLTPTAYGMGLSYHLTGVASVFNGDHLDETSKGVFERDQPVPLEFRSFIKLHGQDRTVILTYRDGSPINSIISPPNEEERDIVSPTQREHTFDPLTAVVNIVEAASRTGRCDLSHYTYDGRRRELFEAHTVGEQNIPPSSRSVFSGQALRCDYVTKPLAGFRTGAGREEDERVRTGTIWLGQALPGGPRLPVQGIVDVRFLGSATMYLDEARP
jgi:hypothetical protein